MKKTNVIGFLSLLSGVLLWGYNIISNFMGASSHLSTVSPSEGTDPITFYDSFPEGNFDWIDGIPWPSIKTGVDYVVHMPLWSLLVIFGIIMLIIGGLFIKK